MQAPIAPGTLLHDRYRLIGVAGQSKFGQTYLARDQKRLNELCVIKEFTPVQQDAAAVESLRQQFHQAIAGLYELQHPQLPRLRVTIAQEGRLYWMRDYIEGKSYGVLLDERRAQGQGFAEGEVIQLLLRVLPVLTYLHNRGVVHRNLALDTLILRQQDQLPVLINFGLVQEAVVRLQLHPVDRRESLGQWGYAPPEQLHSKAEPSSDLYALAVTAIVLLTGKGPESLYDSNTQRLAWESLVYVNPKFAKILRQMLHPNPKKRLAAAQVTSLLEPLLATAAAVPPPLDKPVPVAPVPGDQPTDLQPLPTRLPGMRTRPKRRSDSDPRASAAMLVGLVMLIAAGVWKVLPHGQKSAQPNTSPTITAASPTVVDQENETSAPDPSPAAKKTNPAPSAAPSSQEPSSQEPISQEALRDRRRQLHIDFQFFTSLVDEVFYASYPQSRLRKLDDPEQAKLRSEWNAIASKMMDRLATLKPETRSKLGTYRRANYDQWLATLGEANAKNSARLDALADSRFFQLFPEQKGKTLNPRTFGQVWYAIAEDQLSTAQAQKPSATRPQPSSGTGSTDEKRAL